jgi:hypothetical protein
MGILAQGKLKLFPGSIEFTDSFHRLNNVYFINIGDSALSIQDISYNSDAYYVRFNKSGYYPIILQPGDTLMMDCILQSYYIILPSDTVDTMFVYTTNSQLLAKINIKIDYHDNFSAGEINGHISGGNNPIPDAKVYLYSRNLLIQTVITDINGYYSAQLPPGGYTIAAQQDSFYVTFYGQQFSPYNAEEVNLKSNSVQSADIVLTKMESPGFSLSGRIHNTPIDYLLNRGIVVIRAGTHTPSKLSADASVDTVGPTVYSAIVQYDGSFTVNNITRAGYYYVQVLSDYYAPSYYNSLTGPESFWQRSDSVLLNNSVQGIDILMARDSTFGNGSISGKILLNNSTDTSDTGAMILVQSLNSDSTIQAYAFPDNNGNFTIYDLQYGRYELRAQKIGFADIYSGAVIIDSLNTSATGIEMNFNIAAVKNTPALPLDFKLYQNYPNPFNPSTTIEYFLPYSAIVFLRVYNLLGQEVSVINSGYSVAGDHKISFDGSKLASGIYFVSLTAYGKSLSKKIVLLK